LSTSSPASRFVSPSWPFFHPTCADHSLIHQTRPCTLYGSGDLLLTIRGSRSPTSIPAPRVGVMGVGGIWVRTGRIVNRACRSPHARADQGTTTGIPRPSTNRCPTAGTNGRTGQRAAACRHHYQEGESYHETHDACWVHAGRSPCCAALRRCTCSQRRPLGGLFPGPMPRYCKRCATGRGCPRGAP